MTTHAERARDVRHALADLLAEHGSYTGVVDSMLDRLLKEAFGAVAVDAIAAHRNALSQVRTAHDAAVSAEREWTALEIRREAENAQLRDWLRGELGLTDTAIDEALRQSRVARRAAREGEEG